jgi:hypothetical protein
MRKPFVAPCSRASRGARSCILPNSRSCRGSAAVEVVDVLLGHHQQMHRRRRVMSWKTTPPRPRRPGGWGSRRGRCGRRCSSLIVGVIDRPRRAGRQPARLGRSGRGPSNALRARCASMARRAAFSSSPEVPARRCSSASTCFGSARNAPASPGNGTRGRRSRRRCAPSRRRAPASLAASTVSVASSPIFFRIASSPRPAGAPRRRRPDRRRAATRSRAASRASTSSSGSFSVISSGSLSTGSTACQRPSRSRRKKQLSRPV